MRTYKTDLQVWRFVWACMLFRETLVLIWQDRRFQTVWFFLQMAPLLVWTLQCRIRCIVRTFNTSHAARFCAVCAGRIFTSPLNSLQPGQWLAFEVQRCWEVDSTSDFRKKKGRKSIELHWQWLLYFWYLICTRVLLMLTIWTALALRPLL